MGKKKPSQKTAQRRQRKAKNDRAGAIKRTIEVKQKQEKFKKDFIEKINAQRQEEIDKRKQEILETQEIIEGADVGDVGEFVIDDITVPETPISNQEVEEFKID